MIQTASTYCQDTLNAAYSGTYVDSSFTGKEKDSESGYHYFGARYYDSEALTGWLSVDPMSDKYPSLSPYNYCVWNPVKLVDPDGNEIDLSQLNEKNRSRLINCLSVLTGLSLSFNNKNGLLEYAKDDKGDAIGSTGSKSARSDLIDAIDKKKEDGSNYRVFVQTGLKCGGQQVQNEDGNICGLIRLFTDNMNESDDSKTNGLGMVFLHELRHAVTGESDPQEDMVSYYIGANVNTAHLVTGPVVDRVNVYRQELDMPIRIQYFARKDGSIPFCPADKLGQSSKAIHSSTVWLKFNSSAR